ncbi:MAG TPA: hypothetical protein VL400_23855 [Polyangiaceae bacterium]|nr:hypothetical protein [Polyangiaceae bacterium]
MSERALRPPPDSKRGSGKPSGETDFWAGLFLDLTVRVEWLEQALDAIPREDTSAEAVVRLRSSARALQELHQAIDHVQTHRADARLKPLFALDGPLAALLSRVYAWCEEIGQDFETMAVALRRKQPTSTVFAHQKVNTTYAHFDALFAAVRKANAGIATGPLTIDDKLRRAFDEALEELIWAIEWVHTALARSPGG